MNGIPSNIIFRTQVVDGDGNTVSPSMFGASSPDDIGAANWLPTKITATTPGTANLPARLTRRRVACANTTSEIIYVGPATGVNASTGYPVLANSTLTLLTTAAIYIYSASGTAGMWFVESYD